MFVCVKNKKRKKKKKENLFCLSTLRKVAGFYSHRLLDRYNKGIFCCRLYYYTFEIPKSVHHNSISTISAYCDGSSLLMTVYLDILFTLCCRSIFTQI